MHSDVFSSPNQCRHNLGAEVGEKKTKKLLGQSVLLEYEEIFQNADSKAFHSKYSNQFLKEQLACFGVIHF